MAIAAHHAGVFGARMTGHGFGGAVVMLSAEGAAQRSTQRTVATYREATGREARTHSCLH